MSLFKIECENLQTIFYMKQFARGCTKHTDLDMLQTKNTETGRDFRDFPGQPLWK